MSAYRKGLGIPCAAAVLSIACLFGALPLYAQTARVTAADLGLRALVAPSLRTDTVLHGIAGAMAVLLTASLGAKLYAQNTIDRYPLLLPSIGLSAAVTAGIAKETLDSTGFGDPQWTDLIHTVIGGIAGAGFIAIMEHYPGVASGIDPDHAGLYAGIGLTLSVPIAAGMLQEIGQYIAKRRLKR